MKNTFTFIVIALIFSLGQISAQSVPNGGFENWTNTSFFEEPEPFATSNSLSYLTGKNTNVVKTTDAHSGTYAARLETVLNMGDTIPGLMLIGRLSGQLVGGGAPFTDRPDSLSGYVKYDMAGGDEAYIICIFKNQGLPLGLVQVSLSGSQNSYTRISVPVTWYIPLINPDSVIIAIATTSSITSGNPGSTLYVDDFSFPGSAEAFPNGDFENWTMLSDDEPDNWTTINYLTLTTDAPYATMTSDSHTGNSAIRIESMESFVQQIVGFMTNGQFQGYNWTGGMAVNQNPQSIHGYYKYMPQGNDTAQVGVYSYRHEPGVDTISVLEQKLISLPAASDYTYFEIPLTYDMNPKVDSVNITVSAGYFFADSAFMKIGSTLYLDDIGIDYFPVSVADIAAAKENFSLSPNPSKGNVYLEVKQALQEKAEFLVYDLQGKTVKNISLNGISPGQSYKIDLNSLRDGFYTYSISSRQFTQSGKLLLMH